MTDPLCTTMGIMDIIAGAIVLFAFSSNNFALMFGILMIIKGLFSLTSILG